MTEEPHEPQPLDELPPEFKREQRKRRLQQTLVILAIIGVTGATPWLFGYNFFGTALFTQPDIKLHVYNATTTSIDVRATRSDGPFGASELLHTKPRQRQVFGLLGGPLNIYAQRGDTVLIDNKNLQLQHDLFITADPSACFAVFDLAPLYGNSKGRPTLPVVDRFGPGQTWYKIQSDRVVLPGEVHPERKVGSLHWIEDFSCKTVDPSQEDVLQEVALNTLTLRRSKLERARQRLQQQQQQ